LIGTTSISRVCLRAPEKKEKENGGFSPQKTRLMVQAK